MPTPAAINLLSIDPGSSGTGWAWWYDATPEQPPAPAPNGWDIITPTLPTWQGRVAEVVNALHDFLNEPREYGFDYCLLEFPELWSGSARSHASTANDSTFKLAFLCGALWDVLRGDHGSMVRRPIELVRPSDWKGQMPKAVTQALVRRELGVEYPSHAGDAVAMGLSAMGQLKVRNKNWCPLG